jgi:hypothetical protein
LSVGDNRNKIPTSSKVFYGIFRREKKMLEKCPKTLSGFLRTFQSKGRLHIFAFQFDMEKVFETWNNGLFLNVEGKRNRVLVDM